MRIVAFYIPVWLAILATIVVLTVTFRELLSKSKELRAGLATNPDCTGAMSELRSTAAPAPDSSEADIQSTGPDSWGTGDDDQPLTGTTALDPANPLRKQHSKSIVSAATQNRRQGPSHARHPKLKIDVATWAYAVYAMTYFVALLITWVSIGNLSYGHRATNNAFHEQVPPSINRVYSIVYQTEPGFVLNLLTALVLPLQGLWNSVIYAHVSRSTIRSQSRQTWWKVVGSGHAI